LQHALAVGYEYDPELAPWVPELPDLPLADPLAARARGLSSAVRTAREALGRRADNYRPAVALRIEDRVMPGPGDGVRVRVYAPAEAPSELPGLMFLHGGGFVAGSVSSGDDHCSQVAAEVGAVVVSVDYSLAPEHPFPTAPEECFATLRWLASEGPRMGVDPRRIGVSGTSAGGTLTAALTLLARDRGGPAICFQLMDVPTLDDRLETPSMRELVDVPILSRSSLLACWRMYLGKAVEPGDPDVSPYAAPARATDLAGLPPAFISVCQVDPLRDEGIGYAQRLAQAGVPVELHLYPGTFHGAMLIQEAAVSRRMRSDQLDALRRGLDVRFRPPPASAGESQ
jgi:acetyl esterase/lipase